jgi:cytidylate kinase
MIVAINRELGAGGLSLGEALASAIGAELLDERRLISELANRGGFSAEYLQRVDERPPAFSSAFMHDLSRATALVQAMEWRPSEHAVLDEIRSVVFEHASRSNVVLIGHGGHKLLGPHVPRREVFSLLLLARPQWRIEQVMRRFGIERAEAEERVRKTDDVRSRYQRHFFETDIYDARNYDLVIDTERIGIEAAIELARSAVTEAARSPE